MNFNIQSLLTKNNLRIGIIVVSALLLLLAIYFVIKVISDIYKERKAQYELELPSLYTNKEDSNKSKFSGAQAKMIIIRSDDDKPIITETDGNEFNEQLSKELGIIIMDDDSQLPTLNVSDNETQELDEVEDEVIEYEAETIETEVEAAEVEVVEDVSNESTHEINEVHSIDDVLEDLAAEDTEDTKILEIMQEQVKEGEIQEEINYQYEYTEDEGVDTKDLNFSEMLEMIDSSED